MKVWNDNVHPYKETFKDEKIEIPAKSYILMEEDDAYQFKGTFSAPVLNVDGVHLPEGFKMIRLEKHDGDAADTAPKEAGHKCLACGYKGSSPEDVAEHAKANHAESLVVDEQAEAEIKKRGRPKAS